MIPPKIFLDKREKDIYTYIYFEFRFLDSFEDNKAWFVNIQV